MSKPKTDRRPDAYEARARDLCAAAGIDPDSRIGEGRGMPAWCGYRDAARREYRNRYHSEYNRKRSIEVPEYREKILARGRRAASKRRSRISAFLSAARSTPCGECGERLPPEVMDFDHIFAEKSFVIAHCARQTYRSFSAIVAEVRKCRVVCPNCHRMRHYGERVAAEAGEFFWTDDRVAELMPRSPDLAAAMHALAS